MSDVPKIVHDRLRAGAPAGAHPDADVLTAFAERALSPGEREGVVRHLARCGDCREVVALSIPPMEVVAHPEAAERMSARSGDVSRAWFAWPNLRWAAMAAGVVVVASVLMLRPGKQPDSMIATVDRQAESKAPLIDASAKPPASSDNQPARASATSAAKPEKLILREKPAAAANELPLGRAQNQAAAGLGTQLADNKRADLLDSGRNDSLRSDKLALQAPAAPVGGAKGEIATSEQVSGSSQEIAVMNGATNVVQPAPMAGRMMARTEAPAPIEKAKQATTEEAPLKTQAQSSVAQKKFAAAYSAADQTLSLEKLRSKQSKDVAAQWSLAQGTLQRSLDAGATWQTALQLQHPLLSFAARSSDVWAGGQAGTLFHSTDGGATWSMVQPSTKAESLSSDIVAIEIRSASEIVLSTSNNESWTTSDSGKTWEKK